MWAAVAQEQRYREVYIHIGSTCPDSPLCSFSCSLRCFLKLKDLPQLGSEQVKVFWWTCWYFLWCCRFGEKKGGVRREEVGSEKLHLEEAQGHLPATASPVLLPEEHGGASRDLRQAKLLLNVRGQQVPYQLSSFRKPWEIRAARFQL